MTEPKMLESEKPQVLESEEWLDETDDQRPNRASGQSDPWHGLDDFED